MKNPDRFPPRVNSVTKQMTQETRTYRDHWGVTKWIWMLSLYLSETKVWFSCWGHSCMEKKAGPNQVNRVLLSHNKRIILTLWPHQLWRMSFYSQSVIRKESPTLFKTLPRHRRYFSLRDSSCTCRTGYEHFILAFNCIINQEVNMRKHLTVCSEMIHHAHPVHANMKLTLCRFLYEIGIPLHFTALRLQRDRGSWPAVILPV